MNLNLPSDHDMKDMIRQMTEIVGSAEVQNLSLAMVDQICSTDRRRFDMVYGCTGSAWVFEQYLKNDSVIPMEVFASWWIQEEQVRDVSGFFAKKFKSAELIERQGTHMTYQLSKQEIKLYKLFDVMESHRERLDIAEYSVSETSLEQIFNRFASQQVEEVGPIRGLSRAPSSIQSVQSYRRRRTFDAVSH